MLSSDCRSAFTPSTASTSAAENRQPFRAVGAEDEDALDVAGAAGAADEGDEARVFRAVLFREMFVGGGEADGIGKRHAEDGAREPRVGHGREGREERPGGLQRGHGEMMDGDIDAFIQGKLRGLKREKGATDDE